MRISGPSAAAAGLANSRTRATSSADTATQTFKKADPRVQQQSESVSVNLSSIDKVRIASPTGGTPTIFATSPDTPINANPDVPRAALSPLELKTDQSSPRQLGGDGNGGNSTGAPGNSNRPLENRQTEEQAQVATQQSIDAQAEKPNNSANTAIAAYQRIFSL
jgi:hypothetical protein